MARTIFEEAIQRYGAENILLYTSETGDDIKQNDFSNVNKAWDNKLIVIYTCTVSVGVSCTLERRNSDIALHSSNQVY